MKSGLVVDQLALATHIHQVRKLEGLIKLHPVRAYWSNTVFVLQMAALTLLWKELGLVF